LILVSLITWFMAFDNSIGRIDGVILFAGILAYTGWLIRQARQERNEEVVTEYAESVETLEHATIERPMIFNIGLVIIGLVILVIGSQLLVNAATDIAEELGVSDLVIGLTIVAIGTSLPEFATSMLAAIRGQRDIAVGNVIGSNLFNLMAVLGLTSIVSSDGVSVSDIAIRLDFPVMIASVVVLVPMIWSGFEIRRVEGLVLMVLCAFYVAYLILDADDSDATDVVGPAALIVSAIVLLTVCFTGYQGWQRHRAALRSGGG
jgi:cation:H+ antiporter